ncbi:MAG TPA: hypothetical protein VE712_01275, partial [Actinomycetota bacterium]|nr:hypothetical protein [Actinomycetota bacterium]
MRRAAEENEQSGDVSRHTLIARALWLSSVAMSCVLVVLVVLSRGSPGPLEFDTAPAFTALYLLVILIFSSVGALIAVRRPENTIGWIFSFTGLATVTGISAQLYGDQALFDQPGSLPGGELAVWISSWLVPVGLIVSPTFLLFLFPSGRPASARWRVVVIALTCLLVVGVVSEMLKPGRVEPATFRVDNPVALSGEAGQLMRRVSVVFDASAIPAFLLGVAALVTRFRRSRGEERLQFKWFAYAAAVMGVGWMCSFVAVLAGAQDLADVFFVIGAIGLLGIPIATGAAILRYRLYDIDRIINRTLVYGALSVVLAAIYGLCVVVVPRAVGVGRRSDIVVAGSTLLVAALFQPARRRIQSFIDRRFYRSRYDAERTAEAFGARLRSEVQIDQVSSD